jgi:cytochrome P450
MTERIGLLPRIRRYTRERVFKRLKAGACRKDLFYHLVRQYIESGMSTSLSRSQSGEELPETERPSVDDVAEDGSLAIIAGSNTISSVLTAIVYYLLLNPEAYKCLQEEIDSIFSSAEEPLDIERMGRMGWLNGCMCASTHGKIVL